jgi:hypothetical protein
LDHRNNDQLQPLRDRSALNNGSDLREEERFTGDKWRRLAMEVTSNILPGYIIGKPTPSAVDGISSEEESLHRTYGCELVLQGGTVLGLPQVVIITGQNILNRFYYRYTLLQMCADHCTEIITRSLFPVYAGNR